MLGSNFQMMVVPFLNQEKFESQWTRRLWGKQLVLFSLKHAVLWCATIQSTTRFVLDQKRRCVNGFLLLGDKEWRSKLIAAITWSNHSFNTDNTHVLNKFEDTRCLLSHGKFDFGILRNIVECFFSFYRFVRFLDCFDLHRVFLCGCWYMYWTWLVI